MPIKISQIASNPANGINNIPMNNQSSSGLKPEEVISLMNKIISSADPKNFKPLIDDLFEKSTNQNLKQKLYILSNAVMVNSTASNPTYNLTNNTQDPLAKDIAKDIIEMVNTLKQSQYETFNLKETLGQKKQDDEDPKKKKKRGSPFRVLMGMIGKLLDHGLTTSVIVKQIKKKMPFSEETIERAVRIVKQYNKKKNRKTTASAKEKSIYDQEIDFQTSSVVQLVILWRFFNSLLENSNELNDENKIKYKLRKIEETLKLRDIDISNLTSTN